MREPRERSQLPPTAKRGEGYPPSHTWYRQNPNRVDSRRAERGHVARDAERLILISRPCHAKTQRFVTPCRIPIEAA